MWRRPDGRALVSTADFFTPIVDDPRAWGHIAAANAAGDVYAMGGEPLFALNLVAWPKDLLPLEILGEVMAGGADSAAEGGWVVAGGHTVDAPEPMYGQAVTGEVEVGDILTNVGGRVGDLLVITKAIGTGILATAHKRSDPGAVAPGGFLAETYSEAVASMKRLNAEAAAVAREFGAHAATDVTGFGLLGHLSEMLGEGTIAARIDAAAVPLLSGVVQLVEDGFVPGGTMRNLEYLLDRLEGGDETTRILLADAQTSGGILMALPSDVADRVRARLIDTGHAAAVIGELVEREQATLTVIGEVAGGS